MAESDEWATVETVVEDADSNPDRVSYSQAPGGIEQSILTTSRLLFIRKTFKMFADC